IQIYYNKFNPELIFYLSSYHPNTHRRDDNVLYVSNDTGKMVQKFIWPFGDEFLIHRVISVKNFMFCISYTQQRIVYINKNFTVV
ncbi:hypothetical protein MXB_5524, partial [Myxobolus squamalis]